MRSSLGIVVCVCSLALLIGCGDAATGSNVRGEGQTYCEITCGCVATVGPAPAGAIETCVSMCSQTLFAEYDSCPAEVATWGDCLYGSGTCSGCADEFEALDDCASGTGGTGGTRGSGGTGGTRGIPVGEPLGSVISACGGAAAVLANGQTIGWATNGYDRLGADPDDFPDGLVAVAHDGRAKAVQCGGSSLCILMEDGTVWCRGRLNRGGNAPGDHPLGRVEGIDNASQLYMAGGALRLTFCVVTTAEELKCWGSNAGFGPGSESEDYTRPFTVDVPGPVAEVAIGDGICIRLREGGVYCSGSVWGSRNAFTFVPGTEDAVALSGGSGASTCAILGGGTVFCWGSNRDGLLGGGTEDEGYGSAMVLGLTDAVEVFAGDTNSRPCAVRADGTLWCWGLVGDGLLTEVPLPPELRPPASRIVRIVNGAGAPQFLMEDGTYVIGFSAECWRFPALECEPDVVQTLVPPSGSLVDFRSDQDPGCVLGGTCESMRELFEF
jgi:hypothetical protein